MQHHKEYAPAAPLEILTEAGLRAFDRYHRNFEAKTITLSQADWHRVDDDQTPPSAAQAVAS